MIFTTKAEYGVRLLVELGRQARDAPVALKAIAESEGLPLAYLERIVALLKKAEIVESTRGAHGGYRLARDPAQITMDEVVLALEGVVAPMSCFVDDTRRRRACPLLARRRRPRLRDEPALDARPGRRHARAPADDAPGARRLPSTPAARRSLPRSPRAAVRRAGRRLTPRRTQNPMPELEIKNLHVQAGDKQILKGLDLTVDAGEIHALMGPNGSGKSTLANVIMGNPALRGDRGPDPVPRRGHHRGRPRRARAARPLHGLPVPGRDPRRDGHQVPAHGHERAPRGARRGRDLAEGVPQDRRGGDGAHRRQARVHDALPQRRLLGRREEAPGDPPARAPEAARRGPRRDRLGPRHRRAQRRREGRQHRRQGQRHGRPDHHPLPADPAPRGAGPRLDPVRRPDRQGGRPRARRRSSSARATAGSSRSRGRQRSDADRATPRWPPSSRSSSARASSTSTAPRRRRSRGSSSTRSRTCCCATTRTSTAAPTRWPSRRPSSTRAPARSVAAFTGSSPRETVFTKNATEAINLVAYSWGRRNVGEGDAIVLTELEHHSNIVPWQLLCEETGAHLRYLEVGDEGVVDLGQLDAHLERRPREARRRRARLERRRHDPAGRRDRRPGARRRRARAARRLAGRAADARRRRRRSAPTSTPGPGTRPTARPASACCTGAASCSTRCRRSSAAAR